MPNRNGVRDPKCRLGEILVRTGLIAREHLVDALETQADADGRERLGEILVRTGRIGRSTLAWALSRQAVLEEAA